MAGGLGDTITIGLVDSGGLTPGVILVGSDQSTIVGVGAGIVVTAIQGDDVSLQVLRKTVICSGRTTNIVCALGYSCIRPIQSLIQPLV